MALDPVLLAALVCPLTKQPLLYIPASDREPECLLSPAARVRYRIELRVPVLLAEEAVPVSDAELAALRERADQSPRE